MMITKDDDKGDDKKLKDQSRTIQEFKIRIKIKIQEWREDSINISIKKFFQNFE